MRKVIYFSQTILFVLILSVLFSQKAQSQCIVVGATPGGGEEIVCTGNEANELIATDFPDLITLQPGSNITTAGQSIRLQAGDDTINSSNASVTSDSICITDSSGSDNINIAGSNITCGFDCINGASGDDNIIISDSILQCDGPSGINGASNNDIINLENVQISANITPVNAASGDDQIIIGNNVLLTTPGDCCANISCSSGFDTLTFAMIVPAGQLAQLSAQLASADPYG